MANYPYIKSHYERLLCLIISQERRCNVVILYVFSQVNEAILLRSLEN